MLLRDSCDLCDFYGLIGGRIIKGEVEGLVCRIDVVVDKGSVAGHFGEEVWLFAVLACLSQLLYIAVVEKGDDGHGH